MKKMNYAIYAFLLTAVPAFSQVQFTDVTAAAGLQQTGKNFGTAVADFDNDGLEDIFAFRNDLPCALFKNLGNGTYADVAPEAGVAHQGTAKAAVWADINNDGWLDLFIGNQTEDNLLFLNNQNGTFTNIAATAGVLPGGKVRAALFADVDRDGFVDIYLARINAQNMLYRNNGNNTFTNKTVLSGVTDTGVSMGAVFFDYDNDGDQDLYLTHDANQPFILYKNNGSGQFVDVSVQSGANIAAQGMGVDVGDINNDGWMDIYVTNLLDNALLLNNGDGTFTNIAVQAGVNDKGMGWGCSFLDCDNDGWQDIYMANDSYFSPYPNIMYRNLGNNSFENVSAGTLLASMEPGYGFSCFDYNDDGKVDIYLANYLGVTGNQLFQNNDPNNHHWVKIKAIGMQSNKAAIGTRVTLEVDGKTMVDEVSGGSGYTSQNSLTLHFGLGQTDTIPKLTVNWPNGLVEVFEHLPADKTYTIVEGESTMTPTVDAVAKTAGFAGIFPNPFLNGTRLFFRLGKQQFVNLSLFDADGRKLKTIFAGVQDAGTHSVGIEGDQLATGLYFAQLTCDEIVETIKIVKR